MNSLLLRNEKKLTESFMTKLIGGMEGRLNKRLDKDFEEVKKKLDNLNKRLSNIEPFISIDKTQPKTITNS